MFAKFCTTLADFCTTLAEFCTPDIEDNTKTIQGLNIVEEKSVDDTPVLVLSPPKVKGDLDSLVKEGWLYFLEKTDKSPAQHEFTDDKQRLGLKGFKALLEYAKRSRSAEPFDAAPKLFRLAVDRLAESPFHNGENERGKSYLDWHQLFRSKDFPAPRKLVEFWLDDKKWGPNDSHFRSNQSLFRSPAAWPEDRLS